MSSTSTYYVRKIKEIAKKDNAVLLQDYRRLVLASKVSYKCACGKTLNSVLRNILRRDNLKCRSCNIIYRRTVNKKIPHDQKNKNQTEFDIEYNTKNNLNSLVNILYYTGEWRCPLNKPYAVFLKEMIKKAKELNLYFNITTCRFVSTAIHSQYIVCPQYRLVGTKEDIAKVKVILDFIYTCPVHPEWYKEDRYYSTNKYGEQNVYGRKYKIGLKPPIYVKM